MLLAIIIAYGLTKLFRVPSWKLIILLTEISIAISLASSFFWCPNCFPNPLSFPFYTGLPKEVVVIPELRAFSIYYFVFEIYTICVPMTDPVPTYQFFPIYLIINLAGSGIGMLLALYKMHFDFAHYIDKINKILRRANLIRE